MPTTTRLQASAVAVADRARREAKFDREQAVTEPQPQPEYAYWRDLDDESVGWAEHVAAQAEYEQDCREDR